MKHLLLLPVLLVALSAVGCAAPAAVGNPIEVHELEYARMFDAAALELRAQGFLVDRRDYRFGVITAKPVVSPTVAEPWKPHHSTFSQSLQSTLQHERRVVTIHFELVAPPPVTVAPLPPEVVDTTPPQPTRYLMHAEVVVEHQAMPLNRINGSTQARRMVDRLSTVPTEWRERGIEGLYWYPVDRDEPLEQRLLTGIIRRSFELPMEASAPIAQR